MSKLNILSNVVPLFAYLADQQDAVFWIRSLDLKKQLFLSESFYKVWGIHKEVIFDNPASFYNTVVTEDIKPLKQKTIERIKEVNNHYISEVFFRIKRPDDKIVFLCDLSFVLLDDEQKAFARAGVSYSLPEERWQQKNGQLPIKTILHSLNIAHEMQHDHLNYNLYVVKTANNCFQLNKREAQCLFHLRQGYSNKKIANALDVSPRTIETYFDHLRQKFNVHSRLNLLASIENIEEIEAWEF